jgi:hypothetical protein
MTYSAIEEPDVGFVLVMYEMVLFLLDFGQDLHGFKYTILGFDAVITAREFTSGQPVVTQKNFKLYSPILMLPSWYTTSTVVELVAQPGESCCMMFIILSLNLFACSFV